MIERAKAAGHNSYSINGWHRHCRGIYDLLHDERILDCVEDLVGPNLVSVMTHYFSKDPGDQKQVSWHQDASYWPLTPSKVVTEWLAIDDVDMDNGPMTVIPGSHLHGQIPFEHSTEQERNVLGQSVRDPLRWGGEPVPFTMRAGQISLHTDLLLHGSEPNRSARRRCGLTLRYMPPEVRTREGRWANGYICRGEDPDGYWVGLPVPEGDQVPDKWRRRRLRRFGRPIPLSALQARTARGCQFAQHVDCQQHILPLAVELPHQEADDKLPLVHRMGQKDSAVVVDRLEQAFSGSAGIFALRRVLEREER